MRRARPCACGRPARSSDTPPWAHDGGGWLGEVDRVLRDGGAALGRVIGVVAAQAEHVAPRRRDGRQQPDSREGIGELAPRQVVEPLLVHQTPAVLPRLAGQGKRRLPALDQLEQALGEAAAAAPDGAALGRELLGEPAEIEDGVVPHGPDLGLRAAAPERHEMHGLLLADAHTAARRQRLPCCRRDILELPRQPEAHVLFHHVDLLHRDGLPPAPPPTSLTRNWGVEAPAVTPTRLAPSSHSVRMSCLSLMLSGTSSSSSTKCAPLARSASTTWRLWTISFLT